MLPRELDFRFRGVYVHVDHVRGHRHRQHTAREFALQHLIPVGLLQRGGQDLRLDIAPVQKEHLHGAGAAPVGRERDEARYRDIAAAPLHGQQRARELPPVGRVDRRQQIPVAGCLERADAVFLEAERNVGVRQREMLHKSGDCGGFGAVLAHEFQARGGVVEQVAHGDDRPVGRPGLLDAPEVAALDTQPRTRRRAALTGLYLHPADGANRRERLPAKAERLNIPEVVGGAYFARRVAQEGRREFVGGYADSVVAHGDGRHAAAPNRHADGLALRVDGVLDQFLDHARGAFDDFPRRD